MESKELGDTTSAFEKAIESEIGKFLTKKIFGKLESFAKQKSSSTEAEVFLKEVIEADDSLKSEVAQKYYDKYLSFRTLLSRNVDVFVGDIYQPLKFSAYSNPENVFTIKRGTTFSKPQITCILGKAGQGKTTLLKQLVLNHLENGKGQLPILITLRKIDWTKTPEPIAIITKEFQSLGLNISETSTNQLIKNKKLKVFLDGFDEIDTEHRDIVLAFINDLYHTHNVTFIVTSRPNTELQRIGGAVKNYELQDLNITDVQNIISNNKLISLEDKAQLLKVLEQKDDISNILLTPIIVDIFISTYNSLLAEPKSIVDFYNQIFQILISSHDRLKVLFERKGISGLNHNELERVFQTACFKLLNEFNEINYTEQEIIKAFSFACEKNGYDQTFGSHIDVIDKTSLIKQDGREYSFLHKSILEFYAAKHILSLNDETRKKYYDYITLNMKPSNENVLRFISQLDDDLFYLSFAKQIIQFLRKNTDIFRGNTCELSKDIFLASTGFKYFLVSFCHPKGSMSIHRTKSLSSAEKKIFTYFQLLTNILGIKIPKVHWELIQSYTKVYQEAELSADSNISSSIHSAAPDGKYTANYKVSVDKLIDWKTVGNDVVSKKEIIDFFEQIDALNLLIKKKDKMYIEKNSLSQFY